MHDIKALRDDPAVFDAALARRAIEPLADGLLAQDAAHRAALQQLQDMQSRRNEASKAIGKAKGAGDDVQANALMAEVSQIKKDMPELEAKARTLGAAVTDQLASLPNHLSADVPPGADEDDNVELRRWGSPREFAFEPKAHDVLGPPMGMDFEAAAALSGARFVALRGPMARLERALGQFMLDMQTSEFGYQEVSPPVLVRAPALFGTGQLPKFSEDLFQTTAEHWLIPTAEVALTNLVADKILKADELPLRMTAQTLCFRSEAGAAGTDTRGMIRQHQFSKVELVSITTAEQSEAELERKVGAAEAVLQALELPYRTMLLCAGDTGFSAQKTYDLEVWLPGQGRYREISSCSNCGPFQARRMKARYREAGEKQTRFAHTLNGSGLAVGRTLVAVLETYQEADGSVTVPAALLPYMGGITRLSPKEE